VSATRPPRGLPLRRAIILSVLLSAGSGIAYEILAATTLTDLLGSSVYYFSLVIGIYLAALGIGGWLSSWITRALFARLILIELALAALGGGLAFLIVSSHLIIYGTFEAIRLPYGALGAEWLFISFSLLLVAGTGTLVGLELPLFSRMLAATEDLKGALGKAFFWDYVGGLLISVSLPLVFLPNFGLLRTAFLMGLLNATAALLLCLALGVRHRIRPALTVGLIVVLALNITGVAMAHRLERLLEQTRYESQEQETLLVLRRSPYQKIVLTEAAGHVLKLYLNGQEQFASGPSEQWYHEALVHPAMVLSGQHQTVLILGGGDGLALREVLKYPEVQQVTLVDIDRAVVELATEWPALRALNHDSFRDRRVTVVTDDAVRFVRRAQGQQLYDVIIVDFPDPTDDNLARLYAKEFYGLLRHLLDPEGVVAIQSSAFLTFYHRTIVTTVRAAGFPTVLAYCPQGASGAVTLGSLRQDLVTRLERLAVPVPTAWLHTRRDLARLIVYGTVRPYQWAGVDATSLLWPTILRNPDRFSLWRHYLQPRLRRWWRSRQEPPVLQYGSLS